MAVDPIQATQIAGGAFRAAGLGAPVKTAGGTFIYPKDVANLTPTGSFASSVVLNTPNNISSIFSAVDSQVDFVLMGSTVSIPLTFYSQIYMQCVIANNDAVNPATLNAGFLTQMYNTLELLVNGSSVITYAGGLTEQALAVGAKIMSNMTQAEYDENALAYGNLGGGGSVVIAPSGTTTFLFPISHLFPEICSIPTIATSSELKIRFRFGPASNVFASANLSTGISMQQLDVRAFGQVLPGSSVEIVRNACAGATLRVPACSIQTRSFTIGALGAGIKSIRQVINQKGWLLEGKAGVWTSPPAVSADVFGNLDDVQSSTFYSSAGTNVFTGFDNPTIESAVYSRLYYGPGSTGSYASMDRARFYPDQFYDFPFCIKSTGDVIGNSTIRHGSYNCSSLESFDITPTSPCPNAVMFFILYLAGSWQLQGGILSYQLSASS